MNQIKKKEYDKERYQNNKEKILKKQKEYHQIHKEKIKLKKREYYQTHKEELDLYSKGYYQTHKEELDLYSKGYYQTHKEESRIRAKKYYQTHKEKTKEYYQTHKEERKKYQQNYKKKRNEYLNSKFKTDINFKIAHYLRTRLNISLKGNYKTGSFVRDLDCSIPELKIYLESKFQPGMSWKNWSKTGWHIDHIIPLSSFNLQNRKDFLKACHYTNLQPLWARENLTKGNYIKHK